jgi:hypothetical protein
VNTKRVDSLLLLLVCALCFGKIFILDGYFHDDTAWLISSYSTTSLSGFLNTGFIELRRPLMGVFIYLFMGIHKATPYGHQIWDTIVLGVTVLSSILLYLFIRNLSDGNRALSCLAALAYILTPLDTTVPIYIVVCYRLGAMMSIFSFYMTERALRGKLRTAHYIAALVLAAASYCVFIEGTVTYEPARLALITLVLYKVSGKLTRPLLKRGALLWLPFAMLSIPLVVFKMGVKPSGIYAGFYETSLKNLLDPGLWTCFIKNLFFYNWAVLARHAEYADRWSYVLGISAAVLGLTYMMINPLMSPEGRAPTGDAAFEKLRGNRHLPVAMLSLGLLLLLPPLMTYIFAGKKSTAGVESKNGIVQLFGHSMVVGTLLYLLLLWVRRIPRGALISGLLVSLWLGAGVFLSNVNNDIFIKAHGEEKKFWRIFTERFPALPNGASFFMDVKYDTPIYWKINDYYYYHFMFPLNVLYATSESPEMFLKYPLLLRPGKDIRWFKRDIISRPTLWGLIRLDRRKTIIVHYRDGELLVNTEISKKYPYVIYTRWINEDPPRELPPVPEYPLRHRLKGYFADSP